MRFLACTVDIDPCPPANVTSITLSDALDFEALGITSTHMLYVFSWGFGVVLFGFLLGYVIGLGLTVIKKV